MNVAAPTHEPCCVCERAGVDRVLCPGCGDVICLSCDLQPTCCDKREERARLRARVLSFATRHRFSPRETDVFGALARRGWGASKLSRVMGIGVNTVNNHLKHVFKRTNTHSCTELLALFIREEFFGKGAR